MEVFRCSKSQEMGCTLQKSTMQHYASHYIPHTCVQVQISLSNKLSVRRKMDVKLHEIGRELGVRFGEEELSYDFLAHSFDYFVKVGALQLWWLLFRCYYRGSVF